MNRGVLLKSIQDNCQSSWDVIVIGGGATGAGVALDASSRGFKTLLLEQADFAKGTSSRSTKLIHGGVRYLAQGNIVLVNEALKERGLILKNAPHLTFNQEFVVPVYTWWEALKYTLGLLLYDILAGQLSLGKSRFISLKTTLQRLPLLRKKGLKGGVTFHDGQFDDSRLLIALVKSIIDTGGVALNYCKVTGLLKDSGGKITGVRAIELEGGREYELHAKVVINATGVFADEILKMDHSLTNRTIRPSQGIHLIFDNAFLQSTSAILIPKTTDGRVLFAIPWYNRVLVGTTDTPIDTISLEPQALEEEITFIIETAGKYLTRPPKREDILCVFAGLRPLASNPSDPTSTREISRRHKITISGSGLVTVEGGKWTTYRRMAQDTIDKVIRTGMLEKRKCITRQLPVHGYTQENLNNRFHTYGSHAPEIKKMIAEQADLGDLLHPCLPYSKAEIIWIIRNELPRKVEDVLARRTRALFLDARASQEIAPVIAELMAKELGFEDSWIHEQVEAYRHMIKRYVC